MKTNINIFNLSNVLNGMSGCLYPEDINAINLFNDITVTTIIESDTTWEEDLKYYPKSLLEENFEYLSEFEVDELEE